MNRDVETRDKIIFGKYDPEKYWGGIRQFTCSADTIRELSKQGFINDDECQNWSPSTIDFLDFIDGAEDKIVAEFECYAVSPDRNDYRVTIEGINLTIPDGEFDLFVLAIGNFRGADEFTIEHADGEYYIGAWWD